MLITLHFIGGIVIVNLLYGLGHMLDGPAYMITIAFWSGAIFNAIIGYMAVRRKLIKIHEQKEVKQK